MSIRIWKVSLNSYINVKDNKGLAFEYGQGTMHWGSLFRSLKACDRVDHSILLSKLSRYGVNDIELKWFEFYLSNR